VLVIEHLPRLPQQGECLGGQLEPDNMCPRLGIRRIIRPVARAMVGHQLLDLPQVLTGRCCDPRCLGSRGRDARQLAHRRERQVIGCERRREPWQVAERTRDP
jgi:hypothetical protein